MKNGIERWELDDPLAKGDQKQHKYEKMVDDVGAQNHHGLEKRTKLKENRQLNFRKSLCKVSSTYMMELN